MNDCSAVVETMRRATVETWRAWRKHVAAGTAETPEGLAAFEAMQMASTVFADEKAGRAQFAQRGTARAA